ncbi:hypothetical protein J4209_04020 [Candidatus Woesearchaeota archaeon]|nr:hypothetical protein [Candidatus Woesearchaeota archaeon]
MKRKGQVTVFIILGLIILIGIGASIYYFSAKTLKKEDVVRAEDVPNWAVPVTSFIDGCMDELGTKALIKIGEHGGYIDMNDDYLSGREFIIKAEPTESDGVSLSMENDNPVAYWWYLKSDNECINCTVSSAAPTIAEIEGQVNRYINREMGSCLRDFEDFRKQGFDFEKGNLNITTRVFQSNVVITLDYPVKIKKDNSDVDLRLFRTEIGLNLINYLAIASSIAVDEADNQSLEKITQNLISWYGGIDYNKLPPIADVEDNYYVVRWAKTAVEENIKELLMRYINVVQIKGTKDAEPISATGASDAEEAFYGSLFFDVLPIDFNQLDISYNYLGWPIYFDITPRGGEIIEPAIRKREVPTGAMDPIQTNTYQFFYDISYPVIVEIRDDSALNNRGYSFMFALEGNMRDNIDLLEWHLGGGTIPWDYSWVEFDLRETDYTTYDFSTDPPTETTHTIRTEGGGVTATSLMCNQNQLIGGNISITVLDGSTGGLVEGVYVNFGCGDYASCGIDFTDGNGTYKGALPICAGSGYIKLEKEGYMSKAIPLTTNFNSLSIPGYPAGSDSIGVILEPYRELNANLFAYKMTQPDSCCSGSGAINSNERALITINRVKADVYEEELNQFLMFDGSDSSYDRTHTLKLVPGEYEINAILFDDAGFTIPANCKHICEEGLNPFSDCDAADEWIPPQKIEMIPSMAGGVNFNLNTSYWFASSSAIDSGENIDLYVVKVPTPTCIDYDCELPVCIGMEEIAKVEEYSEKFEPQLTPRIY